MSRVIKPFESSRKNLGRKNPGRKKLGSKNLGRKTYQGMKTVIFNTKATRANVVIAMSMLLGVACGDTNDGVIIGESGAGLLVGATNLSPTATDNRGIVGEGMAYLYQTGFHVDTITITRAGGSPQKIQFVTDTENNVIQEAGGPINFDDFWYDDQGRVASFGSLGASVNYNSDNTIKSTSFRTADNKSTNFDEYAYADGKLLAAGTRLVVNNIENVLGGASYNYNSDGTLSSTQILTSQTREQSDPGYEFVVNANGLVRSAQKAIVGEFDIQYTPEYLSYTVDYDENKNIVKVENFSNEGELIKTVDFTYLPNSEPTPNIAGFMLITERHFREVFKTY